MYILIVSCLLYVGNSVYYQLCLTLAHLCSCRAPLTLSHLPPLTLSHLPPLTLSHLPLQLYVDTDDDVRLARRIQRDVAERGRDIGGK